jgi:hypothetical protein
MEPRDLESLVDAGLRRLPDPRAPRTLLPRVLSAVEGTRQPWYARPWVTWPPLWQSASLVVLAATIAASVFGVIGIDRALSRLTHYAPIVGAISAVTRLVWGALLQPAAIYALVAFLALLFASAVTWRMCARITLEGASQ